MVSFILPAYKHRFLREAIASILAQTYRDFELVVVDDCSPENLKEIVDSFRDERIAYHRNEENIGGRDLVAAWSRAMEYATGEWCVLASDDDMYDPMYLEQMLQLVSKYPKCDLFHCRPGQIDSNGERNLIGEGRPEFESGIDFAHARLVFRARQTMPDFMFRRSALMRKGGFVKTPMAMHSDDATWMMLAQENGCVCSPEVLFWWRDSGVNVSMRKDNVDRKIAASMAYKLWLKGFLDGLVPSDDVEIVMLTKMKKMLDWLLAEHMRQDMQGLGFYTWVKTISRIDVDSYTKKRFVYDRMKSVCNIVGWLR